MAVPFSGDPLLILRAKLREIAPAGIIKVLHGGFGKHFIKVQVSWRSAQKRHKYERFYTHEELVRAGRIQLIYDELVDTVRAEVDKARST